MALLIVVFFNDHALVRLFVEIATRMSLPGSKRFLALVLMCKRVEKPLSQK